jgi:tRNA(Leu) C34 or U34 (ribose-2'-O)-methylase TrmL
MKESGCDVPECKLKLDKPKRHDMNKKPVHRASIDTTSFYDKKRLYHKK